MHHDTAASGLSFAPCFRPFYPGDVQGYSNALDSLVYPGELSVQGQQPAHEPRSLPPRGWRAGHQLRLDAARRFAMTRRWPPPEVWAARATCSR